MAAPFVPAAGSPPACEAPVELVFAFAPAASGVLASASSDSVSVAPAVVASGATLGGALLIAGLPATDAAATVTAAAAAPVPAHLWS